MPMRERVDMIEIGLVDECIVAGSGSDVKHVVTLSQLPQPDQSSGKMPQQVPLPPHRCQQSD